MFLLAILQSYLTVLHPAPFRATRLFSYCPSNIPPQVSLTLVVTLQEYEEAMEKAKKEHLNIWRYGDITADDAKEFGVMAPRA